MRNILGVVLLTLLAACATLAQVQVCQTDRYEQEQEHTGAARIIIPMQQSGLALFRDLDKYENGKKIHELIILDSALQESWTTQLRIAHLHQLIGYDFADGLIYLLFREGETDHGDLMLITVSLETKEVVEKSINQEFAIRLTHFWVVGRNAVLGGYVAREPAVLIFSPAADQLKVVPGFFTAETELLDLRTNQNGTFNTLVVTRNGKVNRKLILRTFDKEGTQLLEDIIEIDDDKNILTGLTSALHKDDLLIAGTYTIGVNKQAAGIFSILVDPFRDQAIHYYDFAQLQHGLDYMSTRRATRIREEAKRDRTKGRTPEFRCHAASVRLSEHDKGFLLLAELYNASSNRDPYYYQSFSPYSMYGYPGITPYSNRYYNSPYSTYSSPHVSTEVRFLSSTVIAFNDDGTLDWDHSLPMQDKRKPTLEQSSDFVGDWNQITIGYKLESELVIKSLTKGNESSGDTLKIKTRSETDEIRHEAKEDEGFRHWYGRTFYAWGYHTVKDSSLEADKTRSVFYIVKLHVR